MVNIFEEENSICNGQLKCICSPQKSHKIYRLPTIYIYCPRSNKKSHQNRTCMYITSFLSPAPSFLPPSTLHLYYLFHLQNNDFVTCLFLTIHIKCLCCVEFLNLNITVNETDVITSNRPIVLHLPYWTGFNINK